MEKKVVERHHNMRGEGMGFGIAANNCCKEDMEDIHCLVRNVQDSDSFHEARMGVRMGWMDV